MRISVDQLLAQYERARAAWPFIDDLERAAGLPAKLLYAVGSRETNLVNEPGDWGIRYWPPWNETAPRFHAYGVWQRDVEHGVTPAYLDDVHRQAADAAAELVGWFDRFGSWQAACNGYNSGQPTDAGTAHGDYGPDVIERMQVIQWCTAGEEFTMDADAARAFQGVVDLINEQGNVIIHGNRAKDGTPDPTHYGLDQIKADFIRIEGVQAQQGAALAKVLAILELIRPPVATQTPAAEVVAAAGLSAGVPAEAPATPPAALEGNGSPSAPPAPVAG